MKSKTIENIFIYLENNKEITPSAFGSFDSNIAKGIVKYSPNDKKISQVTAFYEDSKLLEIGFSTQPEKLTLADIIGIFGEPTLFYNSRDNLTRFEFSLNNITIEKLYCDKDNQWMPENKTYVEKNPQGKKDIHHQVLLDGFCVKLRK